MILDITDIGVELRASKSHTAIFVLPDKEQRKVPKYEFSVCLFVFLALQPIVVVFSQPGSGLQPPRFRGFLITHNDAPQSVGLLWTNDQSVAETST
jgi:hypothetical protein